MANDYQTAGTFAVAMLLVLAFAGVARLLRREKRLYAAGLALSAFVYPASAVVASRRGEFEAAWNRFSSWYRSSLHENFAGWADGFRTTQSVEVVTVSVVTQSADTAIVAFTLVSLDRDEGSATVKKTFQGTWDMVLTDGVWSLEKPHIRQVTG